MILVFCYSGFRPGAFENLEANYKELYFKGGIKTKQSKDRIVPMHPLIVEYSKEVLPIKYEKAKWTLYDTLEKYNMPMRTLHACRHTFKWLCDKAGVDPITSRILMGHNAGNDVHDIVYSHKTIEELRKAINSL